MFLLHYFACIPADLTTYGSQHALQFADGLPTCGCMTAARFADRYIYVAAGQHLM